MTIQFDKRLFIILSFAFIIATVIGTLSHEFGHYIVAKSLGYQSEIHYASTGWHSSEDDSISSIIYRHREQIEQGSYFPGKEIYDQLVQDGLYITIGGPSQTLLTGTMGLILLFLCRKSFKTKQRLDWRQWILIFITLFWLRQTANLIVWLGSYLITKEFSYRGDEVHIASRLGLPFWSLVAITGLIGLIILCIVIFKFIPKQQRQTFILSGIVGGVAGYILWLYLLGPVLLP